MATLAEVHARDIMQTSVTTIDVDAPIREAVETLRSDGVTGAPVVNASGRVVGVFSVSDVARPEHLSGGRIQDTRGENILSEPIGDALEEERLQDEEFTGREDYSAELLGLARVGEWMRPRVISVSPDATLQHVCELMTSEKIHRVMVLENDELRGIISTMDIVRHLAETL